MSSQSARDSVAVQEGGGKDPDSRRLPNLKDIKLPPVSVWPITLAVSLAVCMSGLVTNWMVAVAGFLVAMWAVYGWSQELLETAEEESEE